MNFGKDIVQRLGYVPTGIMRLHFGKITDVTDVVALAILVDVLPDHLLTRHLFDELERFKDRTTVATAAAEVINLAATRSSMKHSMKRTTSAEWMLSRTCLPLYHKPSTCVPAHCTSQVAEEPMQFDA